MEEILHKALKRSDAAEVFSVSTRYTPVSFAANRLKALETNDSQRVSLRVTKAGRIGFSSSTRLDNANHLVERAIDVTPFGPAAGFDLPSTTKYPEVASYDRRVEETSIESMVAIGQSMIDAVTNYSPEVLCDASVSRSVSSIRLLNSQGLDANYQKSIFYLSITGTLVRGTDMLFVGDGESSSNPLSNAKEIANRVNHKLDLAMATAPAPTGELPVVFSPDGVATTLLQPLLSGFNGKNVIDGSSPLVGRLGTQIFDDRLSMFDDGTTPWRAGSRPWDDEGVMTRRIPLIEHGIAKSFLFDLSTASHAYTHTTASAARPLGGLPSPSPSVLLIDKGTMSLDDMISDVKRGLLVESLLGAGQTNVLAGDFSANVLLGYRIEHGRIVGRVKNCMIVGNVYDVLSNLVAIGSDTRWRGHSLNVPALYCRSLSIAGSTG